MEKQCDVNVNRLLEVVKTYITHEDDLALICKAFEYAKDKHKDQKRKSGEPYIIHPLEVSIILAQLHVGPNTVCAGLLHDTVEDTDTTLEDLTREFNADVASIVDGVTKISKLKFSSLEKAQVVNHQKMLLAMAKDIRVILVKLSDRLHNMRTMDFQAPEKQVRIAKETLEIYAPLADKLGINHIKSELEDRSLRYIEPEMYKKITNLVHHRENEKDGLVDKIIKGVKEYLNENHIEYTIKGRMKNTYSIYKKMITKQKEFEDIYDVYAIRIIVDKVETCYQVLGIIHAHYTPIPKRFKDYIAVPKSNMYQSLHTTVIGPEGNTFEVQIRTQEMDIIAEYGVAAHWAYKESVTYSKEKEQYEIAQKLKWYSDLVRASTEESNNVSAEDYVESIKNEILDANVYVYTPNGDVIDLPKGSTPIDFAYKIHTNLGNKTVGAIINGKIVPLTYELKTGDIVSIKTSNNSFGPSEDWMNIAHTSHARHKIRAFLNNQNRDVIIDRGKNNLAQEMNQQKITFDFNDEFVTSNFSKNNISTVEDMYLEIGKGILSPKTVCAKIINEEPKDMFDAEKLQKSMDKAKRNLTTNSETGVVIEGLTNPNIKLANCCLPIPGDEIVGYITKGNGIVVHNVNCQNLGALEDRRQIKLDWATNIVRKYATAIKINATTKPTLLAEILNLLSQANLQVSDINVKNDLNLESVIKIKILVSNTIELQTVIVNLKKIEGIYNIERILS
ncbi:MAG: bifunctional (p)ppGpp synthetase/guanosine-3',5'-bis(diphosphate) 3'-pyrophosphohydrolase [Acholeplasmatales bacterium]|nr:bifunctional (p)ppGpp synthetase/guanosine-3',5'-bis(diphosphate) 3'-pyrophosphohydrolase [Acholeplasmatales bacterium]